MSTEIALKYPIDDGGQTIAVVKLRRPKVRDGLSSSKTQGTDEDKEVRLFASLTGLTPDLIAEMDMADYQAMQKEYAGFLD